MPSAFPAALILWLLAAGAASAERLPVRLYTSVDGLARDSLHCVLSDADGFLWFCTGEGISRYNGYGFRTWRTGDGLPDRDVRAMISSREGGFWVGTGAGLTRFNPSVQRQERFARYLLPGGPKAASIRSLLEDDSGTIWAGTDSGVFRLPLRDGSGGRVVESVDLTGGVDSPQPRVNALVQDQARRVWVGASNGLFVRLPDGRHLRFSPRDGLPGGFVAALLEYPAGRLWVGTSTGLAALHFDSATGRLIVERTFSARDGLPDDSIRSLFQAAGGSLWVGTQAGVAELPASSARLHPYGVENGLPGGDVDGFAEDSAGALWMVTDGGGAARLPPDGFTSYGESDGLAFSRTASMGLDRSARLFVITNGPGKLTIDRFDGQRFVSQGLGVSPGFFPHTWPAWHQVGLQSGSGDWWVASRNGLIRFRDRPLSTSASLQPLQVLRVADGLPSDEVVHVFEDSKGNIWFGTWPELADPVKGQAAGVAVWLKASRTIRQFSEHDGLPPLTSFKQDWFHEDRHGQIWMGLYRIGLVRFREGRFQFFGVQDGVPEGGIRAIYEDAEGRLWLASGRGGLGLIQNPQADRLDITRYTTADGLASDEIQAITADRWGRVYAGTGLGVDRLELPSKRVRHYTVADGLAPGEILDAVRDSNGDLWFGTLKGVSRFTPRPDRPERALPVRVFGARIAGQSQMVAEAGVALLRLRDFQPGQNDLQIDFAVTGVSGLSLPLYQYRLEGAGGGWSAPTDQRSVILSNLRPGQYSFLVRALAGGHLTGPQSEVVFRVLPYFWEHWWFFPGCGTLLAGLAWGAYRYRVASLKKIEQMRTRIARDLHDDVGSALSKIVILSEVALQTGDGGLGMGTTLNRIAETSREVLESVGDLVWAMNARTEHLEDLIRRMRSFSSQVFEAKDVSFRFETAGIPVHKPVSPEVLRHVYLIFKESVNNAARHSRCTQASASLRLEEDDLVLTVADNGTGFTTQPGSGHHGIESLKARAAGLQGKISWTVGKGTVVTLRFPAPQ
jgi:ligand-binding sensor domain-containing protein